MTNKDTMYYGYYRESAKHSSPWICVVKDEHRSVVRIFLKKFIERDRSMGYLGTRTKIVSEKQLKKDMYKQG